MSDAPDPRDRRRICWAVALVLLGFLVAFVPGLLSGDEFVPRRPTSTDWYSRPLSNTSFAATPAETSHAGSGVARTFVIRSLTIVIDPPTSLVGLATTDLSWAVAAATLLVAPLLFLWWRRSATGFGRAAGVASCFAAAGAVCALVLTRPDCEVVSPAAIWCMVPLGGALMGAAFLLAPAPRVRDE
jgi:hypothetical protein